MGCTPFDKETPDGKQVTGFICGGRTPRRRCESCGRLCVPRLCDRRLEGECPKCKGKGRRGGGQCFACTGSGVLTCNRVVCGTCAAHVEGKDVDYCHEHRVAAGFPPLIWREECSWLDRARVGGACLHKECSDVIEPGQMRVLYFPRRGRVMCASCGEKYLKISTEKPRG